MRDVLAIILGGGRGTRLYPLTKRRAKPAVPLAGKYRLIDVPVSNCINSDIDKIYVLTQFNSASLNRHIINTYRLSPFTGGFVDILAAQQTPDNPDWFQGTADAVRQYLWLMDSWKPRDFLILSGDHLYRMDYRPFIHYHRQTGADVTLAVLPCEEKVASSFGLLKIDAEGRVIDFKEKPQGELLEACRVDTQVLGLSPEEAKAKPYIASMGIYVFKREALIEMLQVKEHTDFGKEVLPAAIGKYHLQAYPFKGYWETSAPSRPSIGPTWLWCSSPTRPSASSTGTCPSTPARAFASQQDPRLPHCQLHDCRRLHHQKRPIRNSIIGIRSRIEANAVIENTLVMGADYYESAEERQAKLEAGIPPVGIGPNSHIANAIVDKNARIGRNVRIINKDHVTEAQREEEGIWISNGIVTIIKDSVIPDNTVI
jgi:glucose-1-phosphate adenylyltransferase